MKNKTLIVGVFIMLFLISACNQSSDNEQSEFSKEQSENKEDELIHDGVEKDDDGIQISIYMPA